MVQTSKKQKTRKHRGWKTKLVFGQIRARNKSRKRRVKKIAVFDRERRFVVRGKNPRKNPGFRF